MEKTPNLNLNQIELNDYIRNFVGDAIIGQFNQNMTILDDLLQKLKDMSHGHDNIFELNKIKPGKVDEWNQCVSDINNILEKLKVLSSIQSQLDDLSDHVRDFNNPHKVTADQLGVGDFKDKTIEEILTNTRLIGTPTTPTPKNPINELQIVNIEYLNDVINSLKNDDYWHKHENKSILDKINQESLDAWNEAVNKWNASSKDTAKTLRDDINKINNDLNDHINDKNNPHEVSKEDVGLGKVDNLSRNEILDNVNLTGEPTLDADAVPNIDEENDLRIANIGYVKKLLENDGTDLPVLYGTCNTNPEINIKHITVSGFTNFENNFILNIRFLEGFIIPNNDDTILIHIEGTENIDENQKSLGIDSLINIAELYTMTNEPITCCGKDGVIQTIYLKDLDRFVIPMIQENLGTLYLRKNGTNNGFQWRVYKRGIEFIVDSAGDGTFDDPLIVPIIDENNKLIFEGLSSYNIDANDNIRFYK